MMNRKSTRTAFICYKKYVVFYFVNVFTVTCGQLNASLLNKSLNLLCIKNDININYI